ncbi:MAG: cupin [Rhizobiales bacterium]|nr:cupin [Hyphomicrobiales bacterium]
MAYANLTPKPAGMVDIRVLHMPRGDQVPNNDRYPAVMARDALGGGQDDAAVKALLRENGWGGAWTWRVFDFHHFHPDAFEVLAVARGSATLMLGGPQGKEIDVEAGDVMILPPGFGHRQIEARGGFQICGAYPPGQENYTVIRTDEGYDEAMLKEIASVENPSTDPVWGGDGPLLKALLEPG